MKKTAKYFYTQYLAEVKEKHGIRSLYARLLQSSKKRRSSEKKQLLVVSKMEIIEELYPEDII